jgi:hypothetical protein
VNAKSAKEETKQQNCKPLIPARWHHLSVIDVTIIYSNATAQTYCRVLVYLGTTVTTIHDTELLVKNVPSDD